MRSGRELSALFYAQVVAPQLAGVEHSAALLGWGSDVLGYDDDRSTDHGWGPRVLVFTDRAVGDLDLPESFRGHAVRFGWAGVEPRAWVTVTPLARWTVGQLGVDATRDLDPLDWLLIPQQQLLETVSGAVFADPSGQLAAVRDRLAWYPDQVWRWLLACQWHRLAQEEAFVARTSEVGDRVGSRVIAARQVRELIRLALWQQRRYAPYAKWLGTAFGRLRHDDGLPGLLGAALDGDEDALARAYLAVAHRQDHLGLTDPVKATIGDYHDRPARVIMADRLAAPLRAGITDPRLRELPLIGTVDQIVDSTDVLDAPISDRLFEALYGPR